MFCSQSISHITILPICIHKILTTLIFATMQAACMQSHHRLQDGEFRELRQNLNLCMQPSAAAIRDISILINVTGNLPTETAQAEFIKRCHHRHSRIQDHPKMYPAD